jgi:4-azaleucine resistance transporter AzlC
MDMTAGNHQENAINQGPPGMKARALRAAFPHTVPVLTGFSFLGMAFGILMASKGYGVGWTFLMSLFVFAGSAQYVGITFLTAAFNPVYAFLLTLMINARHLFYGLSLLDKFRSAGRFRPYLIFGLTDESFSILCSAEPPEGVDRNWFMFFVTALNHVYWVLGSVMGGLLGSMLTFNTRGLDFVLTALFVVIFTSQWKSQKKHGPALIGVASSVACLLIFGPDRFIIPAMVAILVILLVFREKLQVGEEV